MKGVAQFVVAIAELAEAEGRAAKHAVFRLVVSVFTVAVGSLMLLLAMLLLSAAAYYGLVSAGLTEWGAMAVVATVLLVLAIFCGLLSKLLVEK